MSTDNTPLATVENRSEGSADTTPESAGGPTPDPDARAEVTGPSAYEAARSSFVAFWSSVKLAVVLIVVTALACIIGTVIPQGDPSGVTQLEGKIFGLIPVTEPLKQVLMAIRAYDVYYSSWFLGLLALFFLNLAVCTYVRVWPRLKYALRRPQAIPVPARDHMPEQQVFPGVSADQLAEAMRKAHYRVFPAHDGGYAADQNRIYRFAPMVVHLGLFGILIGGILAGLTGFKHSFPLMPGESYGSLQAIKDAKSRGALTPTPADFKVRLDKFWMTHYDDGSVRQFYSTLSVLEGDKVVKEQTIRVNEPLEYKGLFYYQSFWGVGAERLVVARGIYTDVPMNNQGGLSAKLAGYITTRFNVGDSEVFAYTGGPGKPWFLLKFEDMRSLGVLTADKPLEVGKHKLQLGAVKTLPGLGGIKLRVGGKDMTVPVESAQRFKMAGYISRKLPVGSHNVFLYIPSPGADLQVVDLESFANLAKIPEGKDGTISDVKVAFVGHEDSETVGGVSGVDLVQDGKTTSLATVDLEQTGFQVSGPASDATEMGGVPVIFVHNIEMPGQPLWVLDNHSFAALAILNPGDAVQIGDTRVKYLGPTMFSGLQTKSDPGIPVIYLGFGIVILGSMMGMFSHKQVWITPMENGCRLGGKANRGRYLFSQDMTRLRERLVPASQASGDQAPEPLATT